MSAVSNFVFDFDGHTALTIPCDGLIHLLSKGMVMARTFKHLETKAVHAGVPSPRIGGAVVMPIFQSAMFEFTGEGSYHDLKYIRLNNTPTQTALHAKLAAMETARRLLRPPAAWRRFRPRC